MYTSVSCMMSFNTTPYFHCTCSCLLPCLALDLSYFIFLPLPLSLPLPVIHIPPATLLSHTFFSPFSLPKLSCLPLLPLILLPPHPSPSSSFSLLILLPLIFLPLILLPPHPSPSSSFSLFFFLPLIPLPPHPSSSLLPHTRHQSSPKACSYNPHQWETTLVGCSQIASLIRPTVMREPGTTQTIRSTLTTSMRRMQDHKSPPISVILPGKETRRRVGFGWRLVHHINQGVTEKCSTVCYIDENIFVSSKILFRS